MTNQEETLALAHDAFFGALIARLPEALAFPPEEPEIPAHAARFFKKATQESKKEMSKAKKRAKFESAGAMDDGDDGEASASSDDGKNGGDDGDDDDGDDARMEAAEPAMALYDRDSEGVSVEELRSRLKEKISASRTKRGAPTAPVESAQMQKRAAKKAKASKVGAAFEKAANDDNNNRGGKKQQRAGSDSDSGGDDEDADDASAGEGEAHVDMGDVRFGALRQKKRAAPKVGAPGSKVKRLKALVQQAEARKATLKDLKASGDEAKAGKMQWQEALQVAAGDKKPVDPSKLKKALKAKAKKKEKSAKQWNQRLGAEKTAKVKQQEGAKRGERERRHKTKKPTAAD